MTCLTTGVTFTCMTQHISPLPHPFHTNTGNLWLQPSKISFWRGFFLSVKQIMHLFRCFKNERVYDHLALSLWWTPWSVQPAKEKKETRCGRWATCGRWQRSNLKQDERFVLSVSFQKLLLHIKSIFIWVTYVCNVTKLWKVTTDTEQGI